MDCSKRYCFKCKLNNLQMEAICLCALLPGTCGVITGNSHPHDGKCLNPGDVITQDTYLNYIQQKSSQTVMLYLVLFYHTKHSNTSHGQ